MKQLTTRIEGKKHQEFKLACLVNQEEMGEVILRAVDAYLKSNKNLKKKQNDVERDN